MVADLAMGPGNESSNPGDLTVAGGTLFFHAEANGAMGDELWKYDGTNPPVMLAPTPGGIAAIGGSDPSDLAAIGGTVFFWADDVQHATELWKSNGTNGGTVLVADINTATDMGAPLGQLRTPLGVAGSTLLFSADDAVNGSEPWKYDGTNPPAMVKAGGINPGAAPSNPTDFFDLNGTALFQAEDGTHGIELWKSPPSYTSASLVADINPGLSSYPGQFTLANGAVFFRASNGFDGRELWKTDGNTVTELLAAGGGIRPGPFGSNPNYLTEFNGTLLLEANDGTGFELWQSDGATTRMVTRINPNGGSYPNGLTNVNGVVYFAADNGATGSEPWTTGPGTAATTTTTGTQSGSKVCKGKKAATAKRHKKKKKKHCRKHHKKHKKHRRAASGR
jgi:ELWxxDGT repeat protein